MKMKDSEAAKIRILVLDDEVQIVDVFSRLMKQFNYHTDFFRDGNTAIEVIAQDPARYDVIVSDIKMPNIDGIEFAKRIRNLCPNTPIIFMTGYPSEEIKKEALKLKKVVFLEKPFPLHETFEELIPELIKGNFPS